MSEGFSSGTTGITAFIGPDERHILQGVIGSVIKLLEPPESADPLAAIIGWDDEVQVPEDPALRRLLPDGVEGDGTAALELRRLTERSVRQSKIGALQAASLMLDSDELKLDLKQAELFARALNDVRLVFAERLGLQTAADVDELHEVLESEDPGDGDLELRTLFYFVGAVQNGVVRAMLESAKAGGPGDGRPGNEGSAP
ncbi:DUF2017 domain-containing protein [Arthrobacter russicus]|uniref:DUF2017 domain-containing protein n=1 Tax=Arthrobacter russicus TaxID=172040 RepID=A0ABU1J7Q1_9MICC|nr:DUF2017 domain-containing protein [Arthrobacter russicus]MBQ1444026.1 DUF2017 domain-containing protein [Renibacterium sp.]MDN5667549.1 DUF2017 domain-containing protein [Renibacterium salmoninarum]MDR6268393.1 hypothetical protein [Arthrobacter russicus]